MKAVIFFLDGEYDETQDFKVEDGIVDLNDFKKFFKSATLHFNRKNQAFRELEGLKMLYETEGKIYDCIDCRLKITKPVVKKSEMDRLPNLHITPFLVDNNGD